MNDKTLSAMNMHGNLKQNWQKWIDRFKNYLIAADIKAKPEATQCAILLHYIGEECFEIYKTFIFDESEQNKIDILIKKFEDYFNPKRNITFERHLFFMRSQHQDESIDQYVTDLKNIAANCEFGDLRASLIRDRIVCGVTNLSLREKLLEEDDLSLEKTLNICRAMELSKQQAQEISNPSTVDSNVDRVYRRRHKPNQTEASSSSTRTTVEEYERKTCRRCGNSHRMYKCPAFRETCRRCKGKGHFEKMCRSRNVDNVDKDENSYTDCDSTDESDNSFFVGKINCRSQVRDWYANVKFENNVIIKFKLDTGAQVNCIPLKLFKSLNIDSNCLMETNELLSSYTKDRLKVVGKCTLKCKYNNNSHILDFFIVNEDAPAILGLVACEQLNLIKRICLINDSFFFEKNKDIFEGSIAHTQ